MSIFRVKPVCDPKVRALCVRPYPGHPKGCPNFNYKKGCPPTAFRAWEIFNFDMPSFFIVNRFDFGEHVEKMRRAHPDWSKRQIECCLYWQSSARKQLTAEIERFEGLYTHAADAALGKKRDACTPMRYQIERCPEAMGINVTESMKQVGIELEWPPKRWAYQIALAAFPIIEVQDCELRRLTVDTVKTLQKLADYYRSGAWPKTKT
jgi:hypothetical protein